MKAAGFIFVSGTGPFDHAQVAKRLVQPVQVRLSHWQARVAFWKAMVLSRPHRPGADTGLGGGLATLAISGRIQLEAELTTVSSLVAMTSIVRDVDKALRRVTADLEVLAGRK